MKRLMDTFRLWLAAKLLPPEFTIRRQIPLRRAAQEMADCGTYTTVSGHLTRAYHAGKRVRGFCEAAVEAFQESAL